MRAAIENAGMTGRVKVVGFDESDETQAMIEAARERLDGLTRSSAERSVRVAALRTALDEIEALECNCSICSRKGALLWFVPRDKLRLLTPDQHREIGAWLAKAPTPEAMMRMPAEAIADIVVNHRNGTATARNVPGSCPLSLGSIR